MTKKIKIKGVEQALARLPEGEREAAKKAIEEAFADFDPAHPVGRPVIPITEEDVTCPGCGGLLRFAGEGHVAVLPEGVPGAGTAIEFVECATCGQPLERRPSS